MQLFLFKMNGHLDSYVAVSVPNGFHETVSSGSSVDNYEHLIDLSPSRCRAPSNPNPQDVVREGGQAARVPVAHDSPSLPTNGVLYRNSSETSTVSHLPGHYWSGKQRIQAFLCFCVVRWHRSLQAKATSYILVFVLCFFSLDVIAVYSLMVEPL